LFRRWPLLITLVSLLSWGTWRTLHDAGHPYGDLSRGKFTDHVSHLNTTRLFAKVGLDLYRKPIASHARPLTEEEQLALPKDIDPKGPQREVLMVDGWPIDKPLVASWTGRPRMHPPGDHVLVGPVALLYHHTSLSFTGANRLLILLFLVYAHIAMFVVLDTWARATRSRLLGPGVLVSALVCLEAVHWSFEGFYEPIMIAPLLLMARALATRRWLAAGLFYAIAVTIHFRALFFMPWALAAVAGAVSTRAWKEWRGWDLVALAATVILVTIAATVFLLLWPTLRSLPVEHNPASWTAHGDPQARRALLAMAIAAGLVLAWSRAWLDVLVLAWMTVMFVSLRESYEWDLLTAMAWLPAPVIGLEGGGMRAVRREEAVKAARLVFMMFAGVMLFRNDLIPTWFRQL
jgi:hypothetical protein